MNMRNATCVGTETLFIFYSVLRDGNSPSFTGGLLRGAGVFHFLLAHIVTAHVDIKLKVHFLVAILNISESVGS